MPLLGALQRSIAADSAQPARSSVGSQANILVLVYPDYHAARPPVPDALQWQFEQAPEMFGAFGWSSHSSGTLEADDLLGSLAAAEADAGGRALIMTGDRDMYQCAGDRVSVVYLKQRASGFEEVDPDEVRARYGIDPAQVPDFIALRGDPSDGLPGAPGIGAKTAAALLQNQRPGCQCGGVRGQQHLETQQRVKRDVEEKAGQHR